MDLFDEIYLSQTLVLNFYVFYIEDYNVVVLILVVGSDIVDLDLPSVSFSVL